MKNKRIVLLIVCVLSILIFVGCAPSAPSVVDNGVETAENNAKYLKTYFGISLSDDMTAGEFADALEKTKTRDMDKFEEERAAVPLAGLEAVRYAVICAGMEELALVYETDKVKSLTSDIGKVEENYLPYFACALDLEIINLSQAKELAKNEKVSASLAGELLMSVAEINGTARNFIGYTNDPLLVGRVRAAWDALDFFDEPVLTELGNQVVLEKVSTGYGLSRHEDDARFLPELTLRYGQDDITHAAQFLGLLRHHGIVAKVQLEPKVSVYEYMPEWGDPGEPTRTYEVRKLSDDFWLVYTMEYDLALEFNSLEDRDKIDGLVHAYAKKNTGEEGKNLLYASWWQPVYESKVEIKENYYMIYDHVIDYEDYHLHFRTNLDILDALKNMTTMTVDQQSVWIDAPFYRYFLGEPE